MLVQRVSVRMEVRRTLTERILTGHYQPGERLVELQVARELGVSQGSVREALRELEAARLVESEPHRGTRVRVVTPAETREAYFVRGALEQAAAPAAVRLYKGQLGPLRERVDAILRACDAGDLGEQAAEVYAFHRAVVAAAGNRVLLRVWESLGLEIQVRVNLARGHITRQMVADSYAAILDAFERADRKAVGRFLRRHSESFAPPAGEQPPRRMKSGRARRPGSCPGGSG